MQWESKGKAEVMHVSFGECHVCRQKRIGSPDFLAQGWHQGTGQGRVFWSVYVHIKREEQAQILAIAHGLQEGIEDLLAGRVFHPGADKDEARFHRATFLFFGKPGKHGTCGSNRANCKTCRKRCDDLIIPQPRFLCFC